MSPLENLIDLNTLYIYTNNIEDASALNGLVKLNYLNIGDNLIEDISFLEI